MLLVIDNYDSFTYNVVQYLGELGAEMTVARNDEIDLDAIARLAPSRIIISPGPCTPKEAGISVPCVERFAGTIPIFGICLGHQSIGEAFGGIVSRADDVMHGKTSPIHHTGVGAFAGLPSPFEATRYHSLIVERDGLPDCFEVTAWTELDGDVHEIMGMRHKELDVEGVQFHPESLFTKAGKDLLANVLNAPARRAA